jgi:hypothetical protein
VISSCTITVYVRLSLLKGSFAAADDPPVIILSCRAGEKIGLRSISVTNSVLEPSHGPCHVLVSEARASYAPPFPLPCSLARSRSLAPSLPRSPTGQPCRQAYPSPIDSNDLTVPAQAGSTNPSRPPGVYRRPDGRMDGARRTPSEGGRD